MQPSSPSMTLCISRHGAPPASLASTPPPPFTSPTPMDVGSRYLGRPQHTYAPPPPNFLVNPMVGTAGAGGRCGILDDRRVTSQVHLSRHDSAFGWSPWLWSTLWLIDPSYDWKLKTWLSLFLIRLAWHQKRWGFLTRCVKEVSHINLILKATPNQSNLPCVNWTPSIWMFFTLLSDSQFQLLN
jgi:hypothetical protein